MEGEDVAFRRHDGEASLFYGVLSDGSIEVYQLGR
jgi:hypothetical protein